MQRNLVLLPGLLCNRRLFVGQALGAHNVIVPETDFLCGDGSIAAVAHRLLRQLPDTFALAGFSYGGYIALELAFQAPDRVTHLALLSSQVRPDSNLVKERRLAQIASATKRGNLASVLSQQAQHLLAASCIPDTAAAAIESAATFSTPAEARSHLDEILPSCKFNAFKTVVQMGLETGVAAFVQQQHIIMSRKDRHGVLLAAAATGIPTLIGSGRLDQLIPHKVHNDMYNAACIAAMHQHDVHDHEHPLRQHATRERKRVETRLVHRVIAAEAGHMIPLEAPDAVSDGLREWLAA